MARRDTIVLCYHAVSRRWPSRELAVTPDNLRRQLELLLSRGYRAVSFSEAVRGEPGKSVAVTFDDAFRSVSDVARPILDQLGMLATVFVPTGYPDRDGPMSWPGIDRWVGGPYEHELVSMGWDELRSLADAGWEVGSHGVSHPRLTRLADKELASELSDSKRICEQQLDRECRSLAYPYGDYDQRVIAAAGEAGYTAACTLPVRTGPERALEWPRIGVYRSDGEWSFRLKVSTSMRRLRRTPLWTPLSAPLRHRQGRARTAS